MPKTHLNANIFKTTNAIATIFCRQEGCHKSKLLSKLHGNLMSWWQFTDQNVKWFWCGTWDYFHTTVVRWERRAFWRKVSLVSGKGIDSVCLIENMYHLCSDRFVTVGCILFWQYNYTRKCSKASRSELLGSSGKPSSWNASKTFIEEFINVVEHDDFPKSEYFPVWSHPVKTWNPNSTCLIDGDNFS